MGKGHLSFKSCFELDLCRTDRSLGFCTSALHSPDVKAGKRAGRAGASLGSAET